MFTTRNNKLPFFKTYSKRSTKQKQKWIIIGVIVTLLLVVPWYKYSSRKGNYYTTSANNFDLPHSNELEVHLAKPKTPEPTDFEELTIARQTKLVSVGDRIPKIVHFVYGLRDPDPTLDLIHYIAIKSAHDILKPEKIIFHYHHLPVGDNFERARPMLTLRQVPMVTTVFGRPVDHYAHKADVVRLQVLEEFGGIYLDLDLISLKPIDHLLDKEFVMAQEGVGGQVGLCNAMMMARPHSKFIQRWYSTYSSFEGDNWNYHSVVLPGKLAPYFPNEITVLNHTSFFWPLWDSNGLRSLYLEKSYDFSSNLGTHIWESAANKNLMKDISEKVIMEIDNSLYCQIRPFLLDGKLDPRSNSCRILAHTERNDTLIGQWPLKEPTDMKRKETNPMPAEDESGNDVAGIIRNGQYDPENDLYLSGDSSYVFLTVPTETTINSFTVSWWMKISSKEDGKMAMVIQTENGRVGVKTTSIRAEEITLDVFTLKRNDQWEFEQAENLKLRPSPYSIDEEYHHYALVLDTKESSKKRAEPPIAFYMDGHIMSSSSDWEYPIQSGSIVQGVWLGSIEPLNNHYERPWDNSISMKAYYRDVRIWEKGLDSNQIIHIYNSNKRIVNKTVKAKPKPQFINKPPKEQTIDIEQEDEDEDEELLWADDDQMDD